MARPRSDEKRSAIMAAAIHIIASEGLGAATAAIAAVAGVSNGSLFTYFETKAELFNKLFIQLTSEMGAAALEGLPTESDARSQMLHIWRHWLRWAVSFPDKRRALTHLRVSDTITPQARKAAHQSMVGMAAVIERSRKNGELRNAPLGVVTALMSGMADTTMDLMISDPTNADKHCTTAFKAMWRMLT